MQCTAMQCNAMHNAMYWKSVRPYGMKSVSHFFFFFFFQIQKNDKILLEGFEPGPLAKMKSECFWTDVQVENHLPLAKMEISM
jgi:hypothetical protein